MVPPTPTSSKTILVVEDNDQVRAMMARILTTEGYRVFEAADGVQALEVLTTGVEIHLIVSDIVMPNMGGFQLAAHLSALPHPPILLFISGYDQSRNEVPGPLIGKPFTPSMLAAEVRRLLHSTTLR
jgi:two-component system, cell cycle sensor histidine kinase and response regulator CckA